MWTGTVAEIARTATDFIHVDEIGGRQGEGRPWNVNSGGITAAI
jgi:hypothetical protein